MIFKSWRRLRVNCGVAIQKRWLKLARWRNLVWPQVLSHMKPYARQKYWPVYLLLFAIAFYLYGPTSGLNKIKSLLVTPANLSNRPEQPAKIETLQNELKLLKAKLHEETTRPSFTPAEFSRPVLGRTIAKYEWLQIDHTWRLHSGIDIQASVGSSVIATAAGTVRQVIKTVNGAYQVILNHGDLWESVYGNLAEVMVREGQKIMKGVIIGRSGSSGCIAGQVGIHFAIFHDGQPVDPQTMIPGL